MKSYIKKLIIMAVLIMTCIFNVQVFAEVTVPSWLIGDDIVKMAQSYLNYPYGWGAEGQVGVCSAEANDPNRGNYNVYHVHPILNKTYDRCFDCSGFVWYVYTQCGVKLGARCLAKTFTYIGSTVPNNESLLPGDILVFRDGDHVGIYIGNNQFIHASGNEYKTHWRTNNGEIYYRDGSRKQVSGCVRINNIWEDTITARKRIINSEFHREDVPEIPSYKIPNSIKANFELYVNNIPQGANQKSNGATIVLNGINSLDLNKGFTVSLKDMSSTTNKVIKCGIFNWEKEEFETMRFIF